MVVMELGGGGAEPVSLLEAKAWCRIERGDEDGLIATLIRAARDTVERETRLVLVKRRFRLILDVVPNGGRIAAPRRPVTQVLAATAFAADGTAVVLAPGAVSIDRFANGDMLRISDAAQASAGGGIEIDFAAGFETDAVPDALKLAVKRIVAASYEVRAAVPADMQPGIVPRAARELIAPFRERRL